MSSLKRNIIDTLDGVGRTTLWTLHCRARAADDGAIHDPEAQAFRDALAPALEDFGRPDLAFAHRARLFDEILQDFLQSGDSVTVVALGEGLETQRHRVEGYETWVSVDVPEVISLREQLRSPGPRDQHLSERVEQSGWLETLGPRSAVIAQGLFMYLTPQNVDDILKQWAERSRGLFLFDVVPPWVTWLARIRIPMTTRFRLPAMPFGITAEALQTRLTGLLPDAQIRLHPCPLPSGPMPWAGSTVTAEIRLN